MSVWGPSAGFSGPAALFARTAPWTCQRCVPKQPALQFRGFASRPGAEERDYESYEKKRKRRRLLLASTAGAAGVASFFLADEVKHAYGAAERSGRVLSTLAVCVNDYRVTLNNQSADEKEQSLLLKACHKRCAERTLRVLEKNGSIFIKLGQHLSSMGYLLPLEWTETFVPLQDKCPVSSYESIEEMFIQDTGNPISSLFDSFDKEPIGSASLAQVHQATLRGTGQKVAVKVQHPNLQEWVPLDMALTQFTFASLKYFFPEYDLEWLSSEMAQSLPLELDFTVEGKNATRARAYFRKIRDAPLVIPEVKWALKRILVMDYVSGHRPDDLEYIDSNHIDRDEVSAALARIFNEMIFGEGAPLHCDPHGGNIGVRKNDSRRRQNFDIILYDHGLYRDIPTQLKRDYAKLWLAVIDADEAKMRKYAKAVAGITDEQFPLFASAITGRDYAVVTKSIVSSRSAGEREAISDALGDGMLQQIVQLLGSVPRIILLILKTNDLTRSLDENLHTRQGPVRTFMILARYCSRTVFQEHLEIIRQHGSIFWPRNFVRLLGAWTSYVRVELRLSLYERYLSLRRAMGFSQPAL